MFAMFTPPSGKANWIMKVAAPINPSRMNPASLDDCQTGTMANPWPDWRT